MASERPTTIGIFLLGRFLVERDGIALPHDAWRRSRPIDLLRLVALAPGRCLHREQVIDRLWPDKDLASGANNLHRALHDLRAVLGRGAVELDKGVARLDPSVRLDVEDFEAGIRSPDRSIRAAALALYRGDLCPDDPYSDALEVRRVTLRQRFVEASIRLARDATAAGDDALVLEVYRRLAEVDPSDENVARLRSLRPPAPSVPVAEPTDGGFGLVSRRFLGTAPSSPLRGRDADIVAVEAFVASQSGVLLLLGEAGVGKTALSLEAARMASRRGSTLLAGAATDLEGGTPFSPFLDAWREHARASRTDAPPDPFATFAPTGSPQDDKLRLFQSVSRAIEALAVRAPVFLLIDDLHLADESSLHLFHYLARATRTGRLLLAATCREEEVHVGNALHSLIASLLRERLGRRLVLDRLDRSASRAQIGDLLGSPVSDALSLSIYSLAEGNPFYTEEITRLLGDSPRVPDELAEIVRGRVSRLGRDAETLLGAASAVGQRFAFELARSVAEMPPEPALEALDRCLDARVLEETDGGYRFRHALVRETVYAALASARRERLHRALAAALEAGQGGRPQENPEVVARHHLAGAQPARAIPHLVAAGRGAAGRAGLFEATRFFDQAVAAMDAAGAPASPERYGLLLAIGQMRLALSDLDAAVLSLDAAGALESTAGWRPSPADRARAKRWASLALITAGRLPEALARLESALDELGTAVDPERAEVLYHFAQLRWHEGRHREAYAIAERCLAEAEKHGDPKMVGRGYEMLALACHALGEWREGVQCEERRQALVGGALDVAQVFDVHL